jgi:hypothetical protein
MPFAARKSYPKKKKNERIYMYKKKIAEERKKSFTASFFLSHILRPSKKD